MRTIEAVRTFARCHVGKLLIGLLACVSVTAFCVDELGFSGAPRGARVLGIDVSHWEADAVRSALEHAARARAGRSLELRVDGRKHTISIGDAGIAIDVAATLARVLASGRESGLLQRIVAWIRGIAGSRDIPPVMRVDAARLDAALDRVERDALPAPKLGGLLIRGEVVTAEYAEAGRALERQAARAVLVEAVREGSSGVALVTHVVPARTTREAVDSLVASAKRLLAGGIALHDPDSARSLELERADLARLLRTHFGPDGQPEVGVDRSILDQLLALRRASLEAEPRSARFDVSATEAVRIVPSETDARVDTALLADAVLAAAAARERRGVLPLVRVNEPTLTTDGARRLGIRSLVSRFSTRHACCERRVDNIHRIADVLDGRVVLPGETFSVNAVVGPRTLKNGFVMAPTIEEGEMVDSIGGGISQFATTLFNALFHGGYDIVERQPHTYWFPRYPIGHEATLSYPKPDLIFRNDTQAAVLIDTVYDRTSITVRLFGDNAGRKVTARVSPRQNIVEPPVEIVGNASVAPDEERVKEPGSVGWAVIVARVITFADGTQKEERRKVTYRPRARRVEVHPCRVPKGEKGYTGEACPEPQDVELGLAPELTSTAP